MNLELNLIVKMGILNKNENYRIGNQLQRPQSRLLFVTKYQFSFLRFGRPSQTRKLKVLAQKNK